MPTSSRSFHLQEPRPDVIGSSAVMTRCKPLSLQITDTHSNRLVFRCLSWRAALIALTPSFCKCDSVASTGCGIRTLPLWCLDNALTPLSMSLASLPPFRRIALGLQYHASLQCLDFPERRPLESTRIHMCRQMRHLHSTWFSLICVAQLARTVSFGTLPMNIVNAATDGHHLPHGVESCEPYSTTGAGTSLTSQLRPNLGL
jgi:hypothetical protein